MRGRDQVLVGLVAMLGLWGLGTSAAGAAEPAERVSTPAAALEVEMSGATSEAGGVPVLEFAGSLGNFILGTGESRVFADLPPGAYSMRLTSPGSWRLAGVSCRGGEAEVAEGGGSVVVVLREGEPVACTFAAQYAGHEPRSGGEAVLPLTGATAPLPLVLAAGVAALLGGLVMLVGGRHAGWAGAGPWTAGVRRASDASERPRGRGERNETSFASVLPPEGR